MVTRTIMIFPEFENVKVIHNIRKKYDPLADLVAPHITLVFPFNSKKTNEDLSLMLENCLSNIHPFEIELSGFSKSVDRFGNTLLLNVMKGTDTIKKIHTILYKDGFKVNDFNPNNYEPHITVGKFTSIAELNKAFENVSTYTDKFKTTVKKISVEMIGEHDESIIIIEKDLK